MDGDITDRGEFDRAMLARFPKARRHRKESSQGWEDTFKVGLLEVRVRVNAIVRRRKGGRPWSDKVAQLTATICGIRMAIDGSTVTLWEEKGVGWAKAMKVLDVLREELLGTVHGLGRICGRQVKKLNANIRSTRMLAEALGIEREAATPHSTADGFREAIEKITSAMWAAESPWGNVPPGNYITWGHTITGDDFQKAWEEHPLDLEALEAIEAIRKRWRPTPKGTTATTPFPANSALVGIQPIR